ncbi:uncharacterized protein LOC131997020 [Stomoxys calcitrans]|uniref:uncharacterized protein LOC131997020 n=1 Tax=Stomoxys calcitrans TaxID=35570 RepID=UPI0027E23BB7|nr:uncharacterized protein LOC131997020 [Stomoxys calcitrans]
MSADRHILYKIQNKILKEIIEISGKLKTEKFRKATLESTSKSLENKMEEAKLNNYKLEQLGPNSDVYFKDNIWERIESSYEKCKEHMQQIREEPENEETGSEKVELALLTNPTTTTEHEKGARKKENQGAVMEQFRALQENMLLQFQTQQEQLKRQQEIFQKKMEQMLQEQLYEKKREVTQQVEERAALKELTIATPHTNSERKNAVLSQFRRRIMKFSDAMEADISGVSIYALENMKSMWEKQFDDIKRLHLELTTEHGMEEVDEELEDIEEKMNTKIQNIIVKMSGLKEESQTVELKRIEIPCFNGNVEDWNSFHDLFKKMVDGNSQLSEVQKLYYLKTNLRGDAFRLIQHLQVTDANYKAAWELLEKRYNNKRILFTKLVDKILDHPSINSQVAVGLRKLLDSVNESIHALKAMDIPLDHADPILARIIIRKLDKEGLIQYEQNVKKSKEIQRLADVLDFLEQQYQALEASTSRKQFVPGLFKPQDRSGMAEKKQCRFCKFNGHDIVACRKFAAQSSNERYSWVKTAQLCLKCLKHGKDKRCLSDSKCQKCGLSHNTLIHLERISNTKAMTTNSATNVLLATAQVRVKSLHGEYVTLRALIDQGSQITSVSEDAAQLLQLPKTKTEVKLRGLGETMVGMAKSKVLMEIRPRFVSNTKIKVEALVLPKLASAHPDNSFQYNIGRWKNINLADPNFNKSERIDMVIGADLFPQILEGGVRHDEAIVAQNTKFGWILSGKILMRPGKGSGRYVATTTIERFWEIEEIEDEETIMEDDYCLKLYEETTRVDQSGRFVVRLPFAEDKVLGESHKRAMARFLNMEKRLEECTELREEYVRTIDELISMGHMVKVETKKLAKYYMPHQAVVRETSLTTKVRVVFDASSKTSNGKSLNDILHTGPKLQKDIFDIITKWRSWRFVISADVEKMFRQIKVEEEDQEYQYVLWRNSRSEPVQQYKLTTVTYGTASAPFLAIRTLIEIGKRCTNQGIGNRIKDDFYMDDLLTGANSKEECRDVQKLISKELETYGLHLRKWIANAPEVLCAVSRREENEVLQIREDECLKTLGLQWNPTMDCFTFNMQIGGEDRVTKRLALSSLAKIFDPLGWLTPVTVTAKLFIQYLWRQQIEGERKP